MGRFWMRVSEGVSMVVQVIGWKWGGYFLVGEVAFWVWVFCWWLGLSVMMAPFLRCTRNGQGG